MLTVVLIWLTVDILVDTRLTHWLTHWLTQLRLKPLFMDGFSAFWSFWGIKKRESHFCNSLIFKWCHRDSNQGHKDFQSFALPTELWHHRYVVLNLFKRVQRYTLFSYLQTFSQKLFHIFSPSMQQNLVQPYIPTIYSRDKNTKNQ